jgi:hypothetical protein
VNPRPLRLRLLLERLRDADVDFVLVSGLEAARESHEPGAG